MFVYTINLLSYKHRVTEGEKAITLLHSFAIRVHGIIIPCEGTYKHDECALGEMKVRDDRVDAFEFHTRVNEYRGVPLGRMNYSVLVRRALEGANARRADCDNPTASRVRGVDTLRRLGSDADKLGMHGMVRKVVLFYGSEGAESDMEKHSDDIDSLFICPLQQLGCEMQARGRSGGRAVGLRINRLVSVSILELRCDIGREWHYSDTVENLIENPVILESDNAYTVVKHIGDNSAQLIGINDPLTDTGLLSRSGKALPALTLAIDAREQHRLDLTDSPLSIAIETRGDDLRLVYDKTVARMKAIDYIIKILVLDLAGLASQAEQTRMVTLLDGRLSDQFLRKIEVI